MPLLPMDKLGAHEVSDRVIDFGLLLPWVNGTDGNKVWVRIINEDDQFLQHVPPLDFELTHSNLPTYGDYWSGQVTISETDPRRPADSHWGEPGRYIYRYVVKSPNVPEPVDWVVDPYAREFGVGRLAAITTGYKDHDWSPGEADWRTPPLRDLVVYELMLAEFGGSIDGAIERLPYLADLGVNCVEVMPVSNVALVTDWGFLPTGYFGVDERFGKRRDFQRFVDAAHQNGIAVIVDAVYGHTSDDFAYEYLYRRIRYNDNPFMGSYAKDLFGKSTDFNKPLVQDFFATVNHFWLEKYHVDGFRYDCVPNYWLGPTDTGYAKLTYDTYQSVKQAIAAGNWQRFAPPAGVGDQSLRLIQMAEQLEAPVQILEETYSNSTWQNGTLGAAQDVAHAAPGSLERLGMQLALVGYPTEQTANGDTLPKAALQYIENHDHERFICNFGLRNQGEGVFQDGNRDRWYKLQPYLIGLMTAPGIPMLWQGQELCENYWIPNDGLARVMLLRPVRWDYFYDEVGRRIVTLVRALTKLRRQRAELRSATSFFYNNFERYQSKGVLLFSRWRDNAFTLVALNFGDAEQTVPFWFPRGGTYTEQLHGQDNLTGVQALTQMWLTIPSNYGRVWSIGP